MLKYFSGHCSQKGKRILQDNVQASPSDDRSKLLITLSAMGFVFSTYSENFSPEQPTATPSPMRAMFAKERKDLINPKA